MQFIRILEVSRSNWSYYVPRESNPRPRGLQFNEMGVGEARYRSHNVKSTISQVRSISRGSSYHIQRLGVLWRGRLLQEWAG